MHHEPITAWSTPSPRSHFITSWVFLHSVILLASAVSLVVWPIAPFVLVGGYRMLVRSCMATPSQWTLTTVLGSIAGGVVSAIITPHHWSIVVGLVGLGMGTANLLTLPWRGVRTLGWPVVTMLGMIAAASVMTWWIAGATLNPGWWLGGWLLGGAVYGLITGPVLFTILHAADSRTV